MRRATAPIVLFMILSLGACGSDGRVGYVLVSEPIPLCAGEVGSGVCDEFDGGAVPGALEVADAATLAAADVSRRTGLEWRRRAVPDPLFVDLADVLGAREEVAAWVVELVEAETARDTLISVASNDGVAMWLNGEPVLRSRHARRGLERHADVAVLHLRAGTNVIAYKVLQGDTEWRLHREWARAADREALVAQAVLSGAWTDLAIERIRPDTAMGMPLKAPAVHLAGWPTVRFRWSTLLGEPLGGSFSYAGEHPASIPYPDGWDGAAVLETEVLDESADTLIYSESVAVFSDSTARRLAVELTELPPSDDPVHVARRDAVVGLFGLDGGPTGAVWTRAQALGDLVRVVRDPDGYPGYPGAQVWGYRTEADSVIPYWLAVPPRLEGRSPLIVSVNHASGPDFWNGRGRYPGFVIRPATLASALGTFGVVPSMGETDDFRAIGGSELLAITEQLLERFPIDTTRVGLLVWSHHSRGALSIALDRRVPLSDVGLAVPDLRERNLPLSFSTVARMRPGFRAWLWSGDEDDVVPSAMVEMLARQMRDAGLEAVHAVAPHSSHLGGLFADVEVELRRALLARPPGP